MCKCLQLVAHGRGAILTRHLCETLRQNRNTWLCSLQTRCHFGSKPALKKQLFADFERTPTSQAALRQVLTSPRQAVLRAGESGHYYGCSATRLCRRPGPEAFMTLYISKVWYSFVPGQLRVLIEQQWPGLQALELLRVRIFTRFRDVWGLGFKLSVVAFGG